MFRAKRSGPGGYVLHAKGDADSIVRLSMSTRLRRAVTRADLDSPAVHLHASDRRRLIGRIPTLLGQRQFLIRRGGGFHLDAALLAHPLGPTLNPLARNR